MEKSNFLIFISKFIKYIGEFIIILSDRSYYVSITARNMKHYKNKGYNIPMKYSESSKKYVIDSNEKILVKLEDISPMSHIKVMCECDNCKKQYLVYYSNWNRRKNKSDGDFCKDCAIHIKLPQSMMQKYGASNCANVPDIIQKKKQTNLLKYGNEWAIASNQIKDKIKDTIIQKYGVDNPMKNVDVKNKAAQTNILKYGGTSPMCNSIIKMKSVQTCIQKYGVTNPYQSKDIQEKAKKTLCKNGNVPSSKPECELCNMLKELFGEEYCIQNYPFGNLSLDCYLSLDGYDIDIEYDGYYWHKNRGQIDAARNAVLMDNGYRIIRIKGNNKDTLPSKEQIYNAVIDIIKNDKHLVFIDMNI